MPPSNKLELVCIGRTCVDLYGEQIGAPLESVQSFQMYVGGSASNVCIGAARLGLRTAMIARVGDDPLGRFVRTTFLNENVDAQAVRFDAERLTGLITLAIRKCDDFPRVFYYENSADLALSEDDIDDRPRPFGRGVVGHGHPFFAAEFGGGFAKSNSHREGKRAAGGLRYRLSPRFVGAHPARARPTNVRRERASERAFAVDLARIAIWSWAPKKSCASPGARRMSASRSKKYAH